MKRLLTTFLLSSILLGEVVEDQSNLTVQTPSLKERTLRKLRLENGLHALLISDPATPSSGAALAVNVGSWHDPKERPGMAHFVEHLLFLGTEKYPEEKGYTRYLDEHGGMRNAFTMSDRTCYMFSVNNDGFSGALDRFGQFFIAPLFSPSGVEREAIAIHQEYCKDIPLDPWRALYVKKEIANTAHPFHAFCIGNQETLAKIERDELLEWYSTHYSAERMHLVVYAPQSLDVLEKQVTEIFTAVKTTPTPLKQCEVSLFSSDYAPMVAAICPLQEVQQLEISWEIPRTIGEDRECHTAKIVSHVLGHEGETSLLAQLKREHLAEGVSVGLHKAGQDQAFFTLALALTAKGVKEYERVIARCFEAIASLRKSGIPRYLFDEVVEVEERRYAYQSREEIFDFVTDYAVAMIDEPLETFPRQTLIPTRYEGERLTSFLNLLTAKKALYTLTAPEALTPFPPDRSERWLGARYTLRAVPEERIAQWSAVSAHANISLPAPNRFLPKEMCVHNRASDEVKFPNPRIIANTLKAKIYACADDAFLVPEVAWHLSFSTPHIRESLPKSQVLADLYCHAVGEKLNPLAYNAALGGLHFSLEPTRNGVHLKIEGISDKAPALLATVLDYMQTAVPTKEEFLLYKNLAKRDYLNRANTSALRQGGEILGEVLYADHCSLEAKRAALETLSYRDYLNFSQVVWKRAFCEGVLYGNQTDEESADVVELLNTHLDCEAYPPPLHPKVQIASLPARSYLNEQSVLPSNAVILVMDLGEFSFKRRAAQEILSKGLEEPFFSELRTKQQTAYLVRSWSQEIERHLYNFFAIQSSTHETRDLLARFELFLESSLQHLKRETIPEHRFEAIRAALIEKLDKPAENLLRMGEILHTLAFDYDGDFNWLEKRKEALKELTYAEFVDYAHTFLGKSNERRLAICINGELPENQRFAYDLIQTFENFRKRIEYKAR